MTARRGHGWAPTLLSIAPRVSASSRATGLAHGVEGAVSVALTSGVPVTATAVGHVPYVDADTRTRAAAV